MIKVIAPRGQHESIARAIRSLVGLTQSRSGCLECHVYQESENPEEIVLFEEWENEEALAAHVESSSYRHVLEWMEMSVKKPTVTICRQPDHEGLEFIKQYRAAG